MEQAVGFCYRIPKQILTAVFLSRPGRALFIIISSILLTGITLSYIQSNVTYIGYFKDDRTIDKTQSVSFEDFPAIIAPLLKIPSGILSFYPYLKNDFLLKVNGTSTPMSITAHVFQDETPFITTGQTKRIYSKSISFDGFRTLMVDIQASPVTPILNATTSVLDPAHNKYVLTIRPTSTSVFILLLVYVFATYALLRSVISLYRFIWTGQPITAI
jgi:hypothetical protein